MKSKLILIGALSLFDIISTYVGVKGNIIEEGNPLFQKLFEHSIEITSIVALVFVAGLLMLIYHLGTKRNIRWLNGALIVVVGVKVAIAAMHLFWIGAWIVL